MFARRTITALCSALALLVLVAVGVSAAKEPKVPATPAQIVAYRDSGEWTGTITKQVKRAKAYVKGWLASHPRPRRLKPAVVLDIDDTSLSLYKCGRTRGFDPATPVCGVSPPPPAVPQTLSFYRYARKRKVTVFFITGRVDGLRDITVKRLGEVGYSGRLRIYFKPADYDRPSVVAYKSGARRAITKKGYRILANIGDQRSDLKGGYAVRTYKLPNPMYFIP